MRILVCGSRTYPLDFIMPAILGAYRSEASELTIIEGGARGADSHASTWACVHGVDIVTYTAEWERHGKAAGPIRNQEMLDRGKPDLVLAFVDKPLAESKGTADMVRRAEAAGVPTYVIEASGVAS